MRERLTNAGKKEQRQIDQVLTKAAKAGPVAIKEPEARTVKKQHSLRHRKTK